jgi:hypothetical protein
MNRRFTPEKVRKIRHWWKQFSAVPSIKQMCREMGADRKTIRRCAKGETYKDVQCP